jgi:hypothetical protein
MKKTGKLKEDVQEVVKVERRKITGEKINTMKIYSFLIIFFFIASCALKVDQSEAKKVAEGLLTDIMNGNFDNINQYYSDLSNESQPLEQKILRFKQLQEVTGKIKSFEFMNSKEEYDNDKGLNQLTLNYKVYCEKVTVMQTFLFINDEGKSKIIFHNIENLPKEHQ